MLLFFVLICAVASCVVLILLLPSRYRPSPPTGPGSKTNVSVQVLVLGDIGRSPRMQYHAMSIAKHGGRVDLIGYQETTPHPALLGHHKVKIHSLDLPPRVLRSKSIPFIISGPLKVIWQVFTLVHVLGYEAPPAQWLLIQNPPSIPTLAIAAIIAKCRNTRLLIDWHNYGWTILSGTRGARHPFVLVSKLYECIFGRAGSANLTVTHAMARQLRAAPYRIKSPIVTMHDRPPDIFQPINNPTTRLEVLSRVLESRELAASIVDGHMRLLVSSTSWTPDEDFNLLLSALVQYANDTQRDQSGSPPPTPVVAVITGKGPQKAMYEDKIAKMTADGLVPGVTIRTAFLSYEDYAALLASADLGVCLHMSSSGVDLPMKVVDMFGAGLPVVAYSGYESFS
ncbi:chitobiosyldiphosphodolichol beta-mannosyltransferase, partial [Magnaporthiopsis poae ATCC 64411]